MKAPPLLIIGLDGASFNVLKPLAAAGHIPNLQRMIATGTSAPLLSTLPPATLPAWSSFLTGLAPSEHGVTDIFMRKPPHYTLTPAYGGMRTASTFLGRLSERHLHIASLGVPGTFPPEAVRGICVSGFDAATGSHAPRRAVWPEAFYDELNALGGWRYAVFNEYVSGSDKLRGAISALLDDIGNKERVILHTFAKSAWDIFFVHLQASDTAGHHLWHTFDSSSPRFTRHDFRDALPSIYRRLDTLIGRILAIAPRNTRVLVISDHGMAGASDTAIYLNQWLAAQGLLQFHTHAALQRGSAFLAQSATESLRWLPTGFANTVLRALPAPAARTLLSTARGQGIDYANTVAFSDELDYAPAIWLNRAGEFRHGKVQAHDVYHLLKDIRDRLLDLRHPESGVKLIEAVHLRGGSEYSHGPHVGRMPDIIIEPAWIDGYRPSFLTSRGGTSSTSWIRTLHPHEFAAAKGAGMPGVHQREGIFILNGPEIPAQELPTFEIAQAGTLVYPLAGEAIPEEIQHHCPWEVLRALNLSAHLSDHYSPIRSTQDEVFSAHESMRISDRLRSMGYID